MAGQASGAHLASMLASMNLSPEIVQRMMRDPTLRQTVGSNVNSILGRGDSQQGSNLAGSFESMRQSALHAKAIHLLVLRQTFLGTDPEHSVENLEHLQRIGIFEMLVRKRHKGTYLLCRIISKPTHHLSIDVAVEDPDAGTSMLAIYHYPFTLNCSINEVDELFPIGAIIALREPYYKFASRGDVPMIRVDAASDIIFLDPHSELARQVSWTTGDTVDTPSYPTTPEGWKNRGNGFFKRKQWLCAAMAYSDGLKLAPSHHLLLLNRSQAYLHLHWYNSAAHDAESVLSMHLDDSVINVKAAVRSANAYYGSAMYRDVLRVAGLHPGNADVQTTSSKAKERLQETVTGVYKWDSIYSGSRGPASRPDIASFQGSVEVVTPPHGRRGLFVTRNVKAGELLLVSKPIVSYYPEDNPEFQHELFTCFNFLTDKLGNRCDYALIDLLVQRLWDDPNAAKTIQALYSGSDLPASTIYPFAPIPTRPLSHPRTPCVDIDIKRVERVASHNTHDIEDDMKAVKWMGRHDMAVGVYELPSFCNHSCLPSATKVFFGDVIVMRAARDLSRGEEVTSYYRPGTKPYNDRARDLNRVWGFTCDCCICLADRADGQAALSLRARVYDEPAPSTLSSAQQRVAELLSSYVDTRERRLCGVKPELYFAYHHLAMAFMTSRATGWRENAVEAFMNALDVIGMVITDRSTSGPLPSSSATLPVDTARFPAFPRICPSVIVQVASLLESMGQRARAANWLKVGVWGEC
ncbi:hypothetical protein EUX98_g5351 [Antrodiella citrinella]|uniref:SET domain-containing protein n=1 Tax=Antrodiella citrinella TaxID=2447956 RepID=A0A4S4MUH6_9APHY|nr:hypothetical protein EUX98_g5351 [Antrodiella citrinella]